MKYAIITDIHEDIINLRLALQKIEKLGCDEIICLGDISGFSVPHYNYFNTRDAHLCLQLVREYCTIIIAGNHDLHAARVTPKISPDFLYPENWYQLDYYEKLNASAGLVWLYDNDELNPLYTKADIEFIKQLKEYEILNTQSGNILLSHFVYPNVTGSSREFYSFIDDFEQHKQFIAENNCSFSLTGHRHYTGLFIASDNIIEKGYNSTHNIKPGDTILVPPITGNRMGNGFCIFNSVNNTITAKKI